MEVVCVCVCLQSTVSTVKICVQEISDFIMPPFFPFSFPCCPISTSPQCFPSCLLTHSLLPSCLSDICLVITSHMLQIWTQIIRVEWLGWGQQWHSPSNLSSDWWCFALPLRHLKNRSSAPLLSPLSVFCFTASLPCLLLCLVSPVFPDFQTFQTPPPTTTSTSSYTRTWHNKIIAVYPVSCSRFVKSTFLWRNILFCLLFVWMFYVEAASSFLKWVLTTTVVSAGGRKPTVS